MSNRAAARVVVVAQARMSSSRLPGKVLMDLGPGRTLELLARRLARAQSVDALALATSDHRDDDPIAALGAQLGLTVVRGPLDDVLERYRLAAERLRCDAIVRITADCPLIEPTVIDRVADLWRADATVHYAWNTREPRTFPDGLDVEVVSRSALDAAAAESDDPYDREHVTPFVRDRPERFGQRSLRLDPPARAVKLSLDTPDDLIAIRAFVARVGPDATLAEIVAAAGGDASAKMVVG